MYNSLKALYEAKDKCPGVTFTTFYIHGISKILDLDLCTEKELYKIGSNIPYDFDDQTVHDQQHPLSGPQEQFYRTYLEPLNIACLKYLNSKTNPQRFNLSKNQ